MTDFASEQFWLIITRLLIALFTLFIGWTTYQSHVLLKTYKPDFNVLLSLPETIARVLFVGLCLFLAWLSGLPAAQFGFYVDNFWRIIAWGVGVGLAMQVVINFATVLAIKKFGRQIYSPWLIRNILPHRRLEWPLVALAFLPAVAMEEMLFRSLWIGGFEDDVSLLVLIAGTSVIFGLMHQPQGKLGITVAGAMNVILSLLFVWSGNLLLTFVAHYSLNMLQLVAAHFQQDWLENTSPPLSSNLIDKTWGE